MSDRATSSQAFAVAGAMAAVELVVARFTGGELSGGAVAFSGLLALAVGAALAGAQRLPGRLGALVPVVPAVIYGAWLFAPAFVSRMPWIGMVAVGVAFTALLANMRARAGADLWRPRVAAGVVGAWWAVCWGLIAVSDDVGIPWGLTMALALAVGMIVALDRWGFVVGLVALWPGAAEPWTNEVAPQTGPDLVLVTVDTLRTDRAATMRSHRWLAEHGRAFEAQAASPWTLPSLATIHTGLEPAGHGAGRTERGYTGVPEELATLAEELQARGYDTAATVQSPFGIADFGLTQGFDRFRLETVDYWVVPGIPYSNRARTLGAAIGSRTGLLPPTRTGADARVADVRDFVGQRRDRPLFLWVHLLDAHIPYRHAYDLDMPWLQRDELARAEYGAMAPLPEPDLLRRLELAYDHEVSVVDQAVLDVLASLPPGAVVVLTSDHGEEFGEHDGWEHGHSLYQELLSVPLVVSGLPGVQPGPAGHLDIAPTLLGAAGGDVSHLRGRDLRVRAHGVPYRSVNPLYGDMYRRAVRVGDHKLIASGEDRVRFDLQADPGEHDAQTADGTMEPLLPPPELGGGAAVDVGGGVGAALEALGYSVGDP